MSTLERNGVTIYYEDHGTGLPVLLTHGYSATSEMWSGQVEALRDRYRVITWDMRGHGKSDSPEDPGQYSEAATVDDMAAVLGACGVDRAVIGGLSLGGYMSMAFHLRYPEMVKALMLFDTGPGYKSDSARDAWNETAEERARAFEERGLDALGKSAEVLASSHTSAAGLARAARGMLRQFDARVIESLPGIVVPVLVVVGDADKPYLNATEYMVKKIAGAQKVVVPDAGHASNIDQPDVFTGAVERFLSGVSG